MTRKGILFAKILLPGIILLLCSWLADDFLQRLQTKFELYRANYPKVTLDLTINQPEFVPGDTIFFSAWYLYDELKIVKGEYLVKLDLIAGDGNTIQSIRFKVKDGRGFNQLALKSDLKPGVYKLVGYTDWMRNFGVDGFFQMDVTLVLKNGIEKSNKQIDLVKFYPEGGYLVGGLENKVVVIGLPRIDLVIRDVSGSEITRVTTNKSGIGSFIIKPTSNNKYYGSMLSGEGDWALPEVIGDGVSVSLQAGTKSYIHLAIPKKSKWVDQNVYAIVVSGNEIILKQQIDLSGDSMTYNMEIPKHVKSNTLYQLHILNLKGEQLAQRVFVPYFKNELTVKFKVQERGKQREIFNFAVGVFDDSNNLIESDISLSVVKNDLFQKGADKSELQTSSTSPIAKMINTLKISERNSLNDFLVSKKCDWINWEIILNDKSPKITFPFQGKIKFKGQVLSKTSNQPTPDSTLIISYLQGNTIGYEAYTKEGFFEVPLFFDFWGNDRVFCALQYKGKGKDAMYSVAIVEDTVELKSTWTSNEIQEKSDYADFALKRNLIEKSYSYFRKTQGQEDKIQSTNQILEDEFQGADHTINVNEFVVFPTMEDFLSEVVTSVQFRKKGSQPAIRLFYRREKAVIFFKDDPLYIFDGVMSKNTSFFLGLKPESLISIKIINNPNKLAQLGKLGENGILFVESKKGDLYKSVIDNLFPITGLNHPVYFTEINHGANRLNSRIPDLRSTLYWNPSLLLDSKGYKEVTFFTSDDIGPMKIVVHGLTNDGRPFSAEQIFNVELSPARK